jgi:hypothetical protein
LKVMVLSLPPLELLLELLELEPPFPLEPPPPEPPLEVLELPLEPPPFPLSSLLAQP